MKPLIRARAPSKSALVSLVSAAPSLNLGDFSTVACDSTVSPATFDTSKIGLKPPILGIRGKSSASIAAGSSFVHGDWIFRVPGDNYGATGIF